MTQEAKTLFLSRSSLINSTCIGVAPPRLFTTQAKGFLPAA